MTGATHRAGGMFVSIVGFELLRQKGLLLPNVNEGLQWLVMYPFTMWGSIASDLDHHWDSCPQKDYPSRLINMALHITKPVKKSLDQTLSDSQKKNNVVYKVANALNAKHRSWQTHSDLTLFAMLYVLWLAFNQRIPTLGAIDSCILTLVLTGICLGIIAHFILDMITPDGIWMIGLVILNKLLKVFNPRLRLPEKLHLVPHNSFFATGGKWETMVCKFLKFATVVSLLWFLLSLISPNLTAIMPFQLSFS
jgi:hypothetical protein